MKIQPILIMCAMDIEADYLIKKLENSSYEKINQYEFYNGTIQNHPIIVCKCNIGIINATLATHIAIEKYSPNIIISQGTAGGHSKNVHRGDIVIGENCINITSYKTPHKLESHGSNPLNWELKTFSDDDILQSQKADNSLLNICKKIPYSNGQVHFGTIGSGDVWNKEIDRIMWFNKKYNTLSEDMESIAVYTVANQFKIPVIGIRIISNNEILNEPYDRTIALKSQEFTYELIKKNT